MTEPDIYHLLMIALMIALYLAGFTMGKFLTYDKINRELKRSSASPDRRSL